MKISSTVLMCLLFISICDILMYLSWDGFGPSWITYFSIPVKYLAFFILVYIAIRKKWSSLLPKSSFILFVLILVWNIFSIIRGLYAANDYYDIKFISETSFLFMMIPLAMVIGLHQTYTIKVFSSIIKILFLFGFILIPLALVTNIQLYARLMIPISSFIIISPFLNKRWRYLIYFVAFVSILSSLSFRINMIRIIVAIFIVILYEINRYLKINLFKIVHKLFFLTPIILLYLAINDQFNIFSFQEKDNKYDISDSKGGTRNLFEDTRTFLFVDVFTSLQSNNNLVIGEGAVGKYKTDRYSFDDRGRYMTEVGFLNTLLFSGLIGVFIFFIFLIVVSYFAIYRSNNYLCKMLGLLISFRWVLFFVEEFTLFDLNFFFYWIIIGLISSNKFRKLSNNDVKLMLSRI